MSDIAHLLNASFLGLIALYVCLQTALTIAQVRSAEHAADKLPAAFERASRSRCTANPRTTPGKRRRPIS